MDYETLLYEVEGPVGTLTLNRPKSVNAVNRKMMEELIDFWERRQLDFDTSVIILSGAGEKGFCAGFDMKDATEGYSREGMTPENIYRNQSRFSVILKLMRTCPQPIIAAVHGYAMGAGMSFAMASDIRLASRDAVFCAAYINIGVGGADLASSYLLWRLVGFGKAAEMCYTGDRIPADEAWRIGLVNNLYERDELLAQAGAVSQNLAYKSPFALHLTKEALNAGLNASSMDEALMMENRNQSYMLTMQLMKYLEQQSGGAGAS
ncbi:MAG: enoyl-CoA hydratase/isomerase family protein [Actinobacteria bacterium]|jgi:enoyl-CoA hydratase/carnithine racemase|nr:MAG: enoyl-CoA hydratase/isomerase family protein [Actinomycetota bacterium]